MAFWASEVSAMPCAWRHSTPLRVIGTFIDRDDPAVVVDVGANVGQSIRELRAAFS